ncbi:16S rRNA (uracil(1498)-N(3))-methyltransferase [uncultured Proteiniphilum sp.]|uniref:16S rRNA (uracil(1498)-N(3))-methyltransferase n=1 Tax=uncultured Proteiniphilum sp. TaxID=497637 RepID=UPI002629FF7F|nr:16S rRNA (uracil(1498)-N(3))-methyltransferase [uncultured Proteiniphilum sp.]
MADTLFYSPGIRQNSLLPEKESQHCVKVLRMREGDRLTVTDGEGSFYECILIQAHPKHCLVSIQNSVDKPKGWNYGLRIAFAPTKQMERNEWFVEKAVEIGIDRFTPILCNYSERKEIKKERLEKIAVSAMKQSQQAYLPEIEELTGFEEFISRPVSGKKYIAHCYDLPKEPLAQLYQKEEDVLILIGPEGDFSPEEVEKAIASGFEPVTLGESRLRTETACLAAIHTIHVINRLQ